MTIPKVPSSMNIPPASQLYICGKVAIESASLAGLEWALQHFKCATSPDTRAVLTVLLVTALSHGSPSAYKLLVDHGASSWDILSTPAFTPLHAACAMGQNDIVRYLLNTSNATLVGRSASDNAETETETETTKHDATIMASMFELIDLLEPTPRELAVRYGHAETVSILDGHCES